MISLSYISEVVLVVVSWFRVPFNFVVMGVEG